MMLFKAMEDAQAASLFENNNIQSPDEEQRKRLIEEFLKTAGI